MMVVPSLVEFSMASTNGPQIEMMFWILSTHPVDIVFISLGEILSPGHLW